MSNFVYPQKINGDILRASVEGNIQIKRTAGNKNVELINAGDSSSITIKDDGVINITGKDINVTGKDGTINVNGSNNVTVKSKKVVVEGPSEIDLNY